MDEVKDSTLSEEIDRLHAEHRRYAQRLDELVQKPYSQKTSSSKRSG